MLDIDREMEFPGLYLPQRPVLWLACIGLAYFLAHQFSFFFPGAHSILMAVWPAAGVGLAALLVSPRRLWPAIAAVLFIAGNTANLTSGRPLLGSVGFMTANVAESLGCAWLILRVCGEGITFGRVREVLALVAGAIFVNAATSLVGAGTAHLISAAPLGRLWKTWYIADGLGILLIAPFLVSWAGRQESLTAFRGRRLADELVFFVLWCALAWMTFNVGAVPHTYALSPYLIVALLAWPALRFGPRGTTFALVLLAVITVTSTAVTAGPLVLGGEDPIHRLLLAQLYVGVVAVSGLLLAASYSEARAAAWSARENLARVRALGDNLPDSMVYQVVRERDGSMRFLHASAGVERFNGISAEQVLRDPSALYGLVVEEDRPALDAAEKASARDMSVLNVVVRSRRADGQIRWMQLSSAPRLLEDGRIVWDGIQTDITERKQTEDRLRLHEERFRMAVECTNDFVYERDMVTGQAEFYGEFDACLGHAPGGFPRMLSGWMERVHPEDFARVTAAVQEAFQRGVPYVLEYRLQREDGTYANWWDRGIILRDAAGNPTRNVGASMDITERKRAEAEMRRSAEEWQRTFDSIADLVSIQDLDFRLVRVNQAYAETFGTNPEALVGRHCYDIVHGTDCPIPMCPHERTLQTGGGFVEEIFEPSLGVYLEVTTSPIFNAAGEVAGSVHIAKNITERKQAEAEKARLEAQLRQAQKMESVGQLAGGVAHDFNNMLAVILGYTDVVLGQVDPALPIHADLQEIHKAAVRSADLTRQLLAFARRQAAIPKVLDLNETVEGMLKMLQRLIGEDIQLNWHPGAGLWPVRMDPSQIDQILANLCVNARDAMADTGRFTIGTENRNADEHYCAGHVGFVPGDYVLLAVSDDGCGMDEEMQARIFEPFFTTKEMGKGTGLGLATIYGIVKQNSGYISVYSELGHGTTFKIYLPRHAGKAGQTGPKDAQATPARGSETILLAEDESALLKLATTMLTSLGYTVLAAGTPGEAIRLAGAHSEEIHLLMTDVVMPDMNGRDLAKNLLPLYPNLKRLFMSGYTADVIAHHGVLDEGTHFIQKPFSIDDLAAKVREVLDGE